jgi:DNA polymerase-1
LLNLPEHSVFVIDASAFVFRAYYALAPLSSKGRPSHAVSGFASMLLRLLREKAPRRVAIVFDSKSPSFRKEIDPQYKANREVPPPDLSGQIEAVRDLCQKAGFLCLQQEGIEADDLIASFVRYQTELTDHDPVVIVSSDKDLTQLVGDRVVMYDSFRDRVLGPEEVKEKYGVPPALMADFLSLTGDSSDNIPGVPGVGPKSAVQILSEGGSLDAILKDPSKLAEKWQKKIGENRDKLELSRRLVALRMDLEQARCIGHDLKFPLPSALKDFLNDWDCQRLIQQFENILSEGNTPDPNAAKLSIATTTDDLQVILKALRSAEFCAIDCETNSFDRHSSRLVGYSLAWSADEAWYIPYRHPGSALSEKVLHEFTKEVFALPKIQWVAHNFKFDSEVFAREGFEFAVNRADDTLVEAHLLNAERRSLALGAVAQEVLGEQKGDLTALLGDSKDFGTIPLDKARDYAAQDAHLTWKLHQRFQAERAERQEIEWLYREVEMPLVFVIAAMERVGIKVDPDQLAALSKDFHAKLSRVEKEIYQLAEEEFNIQSPKQLQRILFEKLKLEPKKKTKTGFSTDESVLQDLALEHPLPELLLEYRGLAKLLSTYVDVFPGLIAADGRIHTQYHQMGTATGRLSSSEPNLQNIPTRSEDGRKIRTAFVPEKGFELMSADYSQVELRLFAHLSGDEQMVKAFRAGRDIHAETARLIFGADDSAHRSRAKAINFGIIYGISAFGLSQQLKISRSEAATFMEAYFAQFPKLKTYMEESVAKARELGWTQSLFGRRRPLSDIQSKNPALRQFAERIAINAPVQGTAADIMKAAMVRVARRLKQEKLKSRLLLQVHDELVLEVSASEKEQVKEIVVGEMEDLSQTPVKELSVPLIVDSGFGQSWAEL